MNRDDESSNFSPFSSSFGKNLWSVALKNHQGKIVSFVFASLGVDSRLFIELVSLTPSTRSGPHGIS